jgi:hypothetical protein
MSARNQLLRMMVTTTQTRNQSQLNFRQTNFGLTIVPGNAAAVGKRKLQTTFQTNSMYRGNGWTGKIFDAIITATTIRTAADTQRGHRLPVRESP